MALTVSTQFHSPGGYNFPYTSQILETFHKVEHLLCIFSCPSLQKGKVSVVTLEAHANDCQRST